jgi:hypothetical protein
LTGPARLSAHDEVAQAGHDLRGGPVRTWEQSSAKVTSGPVQAVLDRALAPQKVGQPARAGLGEGEAGDRVRRHGSPPPGVGVQGTALAGDLDDLRGVREPDVVHRDGLEGADLDAAVGLVARAVQDRNTMPGKLGAALQEGGLVGLDGQQVVRLLGDDEERRRRRGGSAAHRP